MSRGYEGWGGGYGGYGGYGASSWGRPKKTDSHRFATLLAQLYTDRTTKTILTSMVNVMVRNRRVGRRLPRFRDTRLNRSSHIFNAFPEDAEPDDGKRKSAKKKKAAKKSGRGMAFGGAPPPVVPVGGRPESVPLSELLVEVVPLFKRLKRSRGALRFPPAPPYPELPSPATHTTVVCSRLVPATLETAQKLQRGPPQLSDYSCGERQVAALTATDIAALCKSIQYDARTAAAAMGTTGRVILVETPQELGEILHAAAGEDDSYTPLIVVEFFSLRCGPCIVSRQTSFLKPSSCYKFLGKGGAIFSKTFLTVCLHCENRK